MRNKTQTVEQLAKRYREAWVISRRVPSGLQLGYSGYWPEIHPNRWEAYHSEGIKAKPAPVSAEAVDWMVECMRWLRWLSEDERELVWMRASGLPWRVIAEVLKVNRKTPVTRWNKAINRLKIHLLQNNSG